MRGRRARVRRQRFAVCREAVTRIDRTVHNHGQGRRRERAAAANGGDNVDAVRHRLKYVAAHVASCIAEPGANADDDSGDRPSVRLFDPSRHSTRLNVCGAWRGCSSGRGRGRRCGDWGEGPSRGRRGLRCSGWAPRVGCRRQGGIGGSRHAGARRQRRYFGWTASAVGFCRCYRARLHRWTG